MLTTPRRILIISASIGGGHVAAGRALEAACRERGVDTQHVDMLDYTTLPFRRLYRQTYFDLVRTAPDLVDWLGRRMDQAPGENKTRQQRLRARLTRLISYHLPRLIDRYRPDLLLHTHFLPPEIMSTRNRRLTVPQAVVVTDFAAHSLWLQPHVNRYFVGSDEVRVHLASSGVDPDRIRVTGIPIDLRFAALGSKAEARRALGFSDDRDVLLVMAGGLEPRVLHELVRQLTTLRWPLTTVVVCGRSPELQEGVWEVLNAAEGGGLVSFEVLGFSAEVPQLMAAADLMVGKPGGLTSSEALAAGLPFAVVQPYPLQEEANANYLLEHGAAMRIDPLTTFTHKVRLYMEDTARRLAMRAAAQRLAQPEAARAIVASLLEERF